MKVVEYHKYGKPTVLKIEDRPKPIINDDEVLINIHATTVSSADSRIRGFRVNPLMWIPMRLFFGVFRPKRKVLGYAFSGVIDDVGKNVKLYRKGDDVFGSVGLKGGAYAEYISLPETATITKKPQSMSHELATSIPFGAITALYFLRKAKIQKGYKVLIYGASGSLGTAAVQIAKYLGAEVGGVCSTTNIELVKSLGAEYVLDYTKQEFISHDNKYDVIFDTVGKSPFTTCVALLNDNGKYLRAVHMELIPLIRGLWTNITSNKEVIGGVSTDLKEDLDLLKTLFIQGKLIPIIDKVYTIDQIVEAHKYVDEGHKKGNVVVQITKDNERLKKYSKS